MNTFSDEIDEWFGNGSIASGKVVSENHVCIFPGPVENFGFHFSRDLIPLESGLMLSPQQNGTYIVTFQTWDELSELGQEAFLAFIRNSKSVAEK